MTFSGICRLARRDALYAVGGFQPEMATAGALGARDGPGTAALRLHAGVLAPPPAGRDLARGRRFCPLGAFFLVLTVAWVVLVLVLVSDETRFGANPVIAYWAW